MTVTSDGALTGGMGCRYSSKTGMSLYRSVLQLLYQYDGVITEKQIRQALSLYPAGDKDELNEVLLSDGHFVHCYDSAWKCAPLDRFVENRPLEEVTFIITDIETTGSIQGKDRIIELAALKTRNGEIQDRFESLVNPEKPISAQISRLTRISNQAVEDAPVIETALPEFVQFAQGGIFVGHNSYFEFSFIQTELERLHLKPLVPQLEICTYRLARKLLPDVRARGVRGLSVFFNYQMENHHRAMPDVMATWYFLQKFLEQLRQIGVTTLYQLIEYQRVRLNKRELMRKIRRQRRKKLTIPVDPAGVFN